MTKLTMNQVNLETAIKNLRDLADDCESARDEVVQYYNDGGDTLERHGHNEPDAFSLAVNAAITKVRDRADDIERHKNDIVTLNESGVAPMDADGIITLTTPDNVDYPDDSTHTDFVAWAEGVIIRPFRSGRRSREKERRLRCRSSGSNRLNIRPNQFYSVCDYPRYTRKTSHLINGRLLAQEHLPSSLSASTNISSIDNTRRLL